MTHLPYIAASYGLAVVVAGWLSIDAWLRMRRAQTRLRAIDTRAVNGPGRR